MHVQIASNMRLDCAMRRLAVLTRKRLYANPDIVGEKSVHRATHVLTRSMAFYAFDSARTSERIKPRKNGRCVLFYTLITKNDEKEAQLGTIFFKRKRKNRKKHSAGGHFPLPYDA